MKNTAHDMALPGACDGAGSLRQPSISALHIRTKAIPAIQRGKPFSDSRAHGIADARAHGRADAGSVAGTRLPVGDAFSSEYGGSPQRGKIRKWEQPILIEVSGSRPEDLATLDSTSGWHD